MSVRVADIGKVHFFPAAAASRQVLLAMAAA